MTDGGLSFIPVPRQGKEMLGKRRPGMAVACFLGALLWGSLS
jgi:hypothetical protein